MSVAAVIIVLGLVFIAFMGYIYRDVIYALVAPRPSSTTPGLAYPTPDSIQSPEPDTQSYVPPPSTETVIAPVQESTSPITSFLPVTSSTAPTTQTTSTTTSSSTVVSAPTYESTTLTSPLWLLGTTTPTTSTSTTPTTSTSTTPTSATVDPSLYLAGYTKRSAPLPTVAYVIDASKDFNAKTVSSCAQSCTTNSETCDSFYFTNTGVAQTCHLVPLVIPNSLLTTNSTDAASYYTKNTSTGLKTIKYGDLVFIKNTSSQYNQFMSACGDTGSACGINVSLRPDSTVNSSDTIKYRAWKLMPTPSSIRVVGDPVYYGDSLTIQSMYNGLFVSPCGSNYCTSGTNVTLRPTSNTPDDSLITWKIQSQDTRKNTGLYPVVPSDVVSFNVYASKYSGHTGALDLCGSAATGCGTNVSLRSPPMYPTWTITLAQ